MDENNIQIKASKESINELGKRKNISQLYKAIISFKNNQFHTRYNNSNGMK